MRCLGALGLLFAFVYLDCRGVGAVAETKNGRNDKESFDAKDVPYPAAQEGNEDGDEVVDADAGGDGCLHLLLIVRDVLHVDVGSHGGE